MCPFLIIRVAFYFQNIEVFQLIHKQIVAHESQMRLLLAENAINISLSPDSEKLLDDNQ